MQISKDVIQLWSSIGLCGGTLTCTYVSVCLSVHPCIYEYVSIML